MPDEKTRLAALQKEFEALKNKLASYEESFETTIKENPLASVGVAFGVGAAIGALFVAYLMKGKN